VAGPDEEWRLLLRALKNEKIRARRNRREERTTCVNNIVASLLIPGHAKVVLYDIFKRRENVNRVIIIKPDTVRRQILDELTKINRRENKTIWTIGGIFITANTIRLIESKE